MGSLWDDRLAEVWAAPGHAGSGVVLGALGVLTARHVIAEVADGAAAGQVLARVIRRGASTPTWVPMCVVDSDPAWDLAVLEVDRTHPDAAAWLRPGSPSPTVVTVRGAAEEDCEAVGFPDEQVQRPEAAASPGEWVRQSEQLHGTLSPMGQAKPPVAPRPGLPREWMPLDADTSTPGEQAGWRGMSGAGVVLPDPDGWLVGIVVAAEGAHQQRRLCVVPLAAALTQSTSLAAATAAVTGAPVIPRVRAAPLYGRLLYPESLGADGAPLRLGEVSDRGVFGVKPVDLAGEPTYLNYVPRDDDDRLTQALGEATATKRMLLLVGDSGSGKSRSAAQAAGDVFPAHRLLRPVEHQLPELPELPLADLGLALVWLDDIEKYAAHAALRAILKRLLDAGVGIIGTVRRKELQALTVTGEIRNPAGEALTDQRLVHRLDWKRDWSQPERDRTAQHVTNLLARQAVAAGIPLGVWAVAGPQLVHQLDDARGNEDNPCQFALVRAVLDWYRTGLTIPIPQPVAIDLLNAYLDQRASDEDITDAISWCTHPIDVGGRRARYSLLMFQHDQSLVINDYVQDHDRRHDPPPVPDPTWSAALANAPDDDSIFGVGIAAYEAGRVATAQIAMRTLANAGHTGAMYNLGLLLKEQEPAAARHWYERAANAGHTGAMNNLGLLLKEQDPAKARDWWERAATAGDTDAMYNLGLLLEEQEPAAARHWYERAATAGHTDAMNNLGVLLEEQEPAAARHWYERAATAGHTGAMYNLGLLLKEQEPAAARHWYERAATAGHTDAMNNLGLLLADEDPAAARHWYERAATAGRTDAMNNLGVLLADEDPAAARHWWERAATAGRTDAMNNLGLLLADEDPTAARDWYERAANASRTNAKSASEG
jgi:TPR repeat protein